MTAASSVPWSEVAVARRLYRTGESEYLLNRNVCRLRDIQDLFAGTGVNPKAYALMDQERLNHVLTAKPWERRVFIEEAAGIARYKQQRAETQGKLDATRPEPPARLRDVMEEVRRQLSSIERQARKAQQYKALHQERQGLDLALLAADCAALAAQHEALTREMAQLRETEEQRAGARSPSLSRAAGAAVRGDPGDRVPAGRPAAVGAEDPGRGRAPARAAGADGAADPRSARGGGRAARRRRSAGSRERRVAARAERDDKSRALDEARERHGRSGRGRCERDRGAARGLPGRAPRAPGALRGAAARADPGGRARAPS